MNTFKDEYLNLKEKVISELLKIKNRPEKWLPQIVYVANDDEDVCEPNINLYHSYLLKEYFEDGECIFETYFGKQEHGELMEIKTTSLIELLENYNKLKL